MRTESTRWAMRLIGFAAAAGITLGQAPGLVPLPPAQAAPSAAVTGIFNWIHSTADLDRGYAFYHEVFGLEMIEPAVRRYPRRASSEHHTEAVGSDCRSGDRRTDKHESARFRNVFMRLPNAPFGLELSEFNDIESRALRPNFWDPGATTLILEVRDINAVA